MTEEIKKIDIKKVFYLCSPLLNKECTKENCYINNGCCCHTVNEKYSQEHLLNYITNLQKENENLLYEINGYLKEKEELKEKINKLEDYKQRNEKAIEFTKEWWYEKNTRDINRIVSLGDKRIDLLNILKGGDE